jgi:hypothetical protein
MITAAALCPSPPLLARELTGADPVVPELRQACRDAVARLLDSGPDVVAVVGAGEQTRTWDGGTRMDLSGFAPGIAPAAKDGSPGLPLPLGLGARLLDQAGYAGPRALHLVAEDEPVERCAELGTRIACSAGRVALLAMADGTARRGPKAPGYFDARSGPFDAEVERAVRDGDLEALLAVDPDLARELMATGRTSWQVLAGALRDTALASEIIYRDDPFGVAYLVASLSVCYTAPASTLGPNLAILSINIGAPEINKDNPRGMER